MLRDKKIFCLYPVNQTSRMNKFLIFIGFAYETRSRRYGDRIGLGQSEIFKIHGLHKQIAALKTCDYS